jgi:LPXTG-site transpeptidase (sortase) family protein
LPGLTGANVDETDTDFTSVVPAGWTQTEGTNPDVNVNVLPGGNVDAGNDGYYTPASISGHVYHDYNGDGTQDLNGADNIAGNADDEVDLANVDVLITPSSGAAFTVSTNGTGDWVAMVPPGSASANVRETDVDFTSLIPSGWIRTEGTDSTTVMAVAGSSVSAGIDGYYVPGTIHGHVYYDYNLDSIQDADGADNVPGTADDEPNLANVDVVITEADGSTQTVQTDASGNWTADVVPGDTDVDVNEVDIDFTNVVPVGFIQTEGTDPENNIPVGAGANVDAGNDGYGTPGIVTGHVYYDLNGDGSQDLDGVDNIAGNADDEVNLANVDVSITPASGVPFTVPTNGTGDWIATVPPGNTSANIQETDADFTSIVPAGWTRTEGTDPTAAIAVAGSSVSAGNDGYYTPASVSGHVYYDRNGDGTQDLDGVDNVAGNADDEVNLASVDVVITEADGTTQTVVTDANGDWTATVVPGSTSANVSETDPQFTAVVPAGWTRTEGTDPTTVITVAGVTAPTDNDGYYTPGTVHGHVYFDYNLDATQDLDGADNIAGNADDEVNLANVDINITEADGTTQTVVTNASGNWIANVVPGDTDVDVDETDPQFTAIVPAGFTQTEGTDPQFNLLVGEGANVDAGNDGYGTPGAISGQVRDDTDHDGNPADADSGIDIVTIALRSAGLDGSYNTADDVTVTTTTSGTGNYTFNNVTPDDYRIEESNPAGYVSTYDTQGANNDQILITVTPGTPNSGNDFLDTNRADVSGQVRNDTDSDGNPADADSGVDNVTITLRSAGLDGTYNTGDDVTVTTTTNGTGIYTFTNVLAGNYRIEETNLAGYTSTYDTESANDDQIHIVLAANINSTGNDFLDHQDTYSISGTVYDDSTGSSNDAFDAGDNPLNNVTVQLFAADAAGNPVGPELGNRSTSGGNYSFANLLPGDYVVVETDPGSYVSITDVDGDTTSPAYNRIPVTISNANVTGRNFLDEVIGPSALIKTLIDHNEASTIPPDVAIGEMVTYEVRATIPAGAVYTNARLVDTMDRGLSYMDCRGITDNGLTTDVVGGFTAICSAPTVDNAGGGTTVDVRRRVTFDFGTLTNATGADQTLVVTYRAVILDSAGNISGISLDNSAEWTWAGGSLGPVSETVGVVEPDISILTNANTQVTSVGSEITITLAIQHTANSDANAYETIVTNTLPAELQYVPGSLECTSGAQDANALCAEAGGTITAQWSTFALGGGDGRVTFRVTVVSLPASGILNTANVAWTSLPGDVSVPQNANVFSTERDYDPGSSINIYGNSHVLTLGVPASGRNSNDNNAAKAKQLPSTGFAPNQVTDLSNLTREAYAVTNGVTVEIPSLGVEIPIVGVPFKNGTWNVSWLGAQAGWLEGTAFPSWNGNSVLTGHVYLANGAPGPFVNLYTLKYGEKVIVHAYGQKYSFEVRSNETVEPNNSSAFKHEERPWLTLVTCKEYDEKTNSYRKRVVIRAVLVSVTAE